MKAELKKAIRGLWYISETDAPFKIIKRKTLPLGKTDAIEFVDFFDQQTLKAVRADDEPQAQKYRELRKLLNSLRYKTVLKIGDVEIDIFIYGIDEGGNVVGIQTKSVET